MAIVGVSNPVRVRQPIQQLDCGFRLESLSLIRDSDQCTACVGDLTEAVGLSQPTVSHHLRVLVDAGILSKEKDGYWT